MKQKQFISKSVVCNRYPGGGEMRAKSNACELTSTPCSRRSHSHGCDWLKCINSFTARIDNSTFPSSRQLFLPAAFYFWFSGRFNFLPVDGTTSTGRPKGSASRATFCSWGHPVLSGSGVAGFEPPPTGDNVWCSSPAFQAVLQEENPSPLAERLHLLFEREELGGTWKRQERWCSAGLCILTLSFSSLYLLSRTIKSHGLVISKLTCDLGNSEMFSCGGMENLLLCWRCSVSSCHTHGNKENNWNNRGFSLISC